MDDPKRLLATLNRSSLQRDNLPVYQVIKALLDNQTEMNAKTATLPVSGSTVKASTGIETSGNSVGLNENGRRRSLDFIIDGSGDTITTGIKGDKEIPYACKIVAAHLFADRVGSISLDIWKSNFAGFPPSQVNSITDTTPPTITNAQSAEDSTLSGWNPKIDAGDILRFNVSLIASITRVTVSLILELDV